MIDLLKNESKEYWLEKLTADFSFTDLMPDQDLLDVEKSNYEAISFKLSDECFDLLSEKTNKSPFLIYTVLLSSLNICLYKYTKNEIIVVGSPARVHQEIEDQISNALPIINKIDTEISFKDFLKIVRNTLVEAYQHQSFDYDYMIELLGTAEHSDKFPLFDISMSLVGIHSDLPNVGNGINLILTLEENDLSVEVKFKQHLYKTETINRFSIHLQNILFNALKNLEQPLSTIEMIDEKELDELMQLSGKHTFYTTDLLTASELFEHAVDRFPDLTALVSAETSLTYAELDRAANRLAHFLRAKNISAEKRVAIMLERSAEMLTAVLAVFKCGGVYVPLDSAYPKERLNYMIEDAQPELILTQTQLEERLPWTTAEVVRLDEEAEAIASQSSERLDRSAELLNGAYMIYTSGSTGKPKGVVVTHSGLESLAKEQAEKFGVGAGSRVLQFASLSFDASVFDFSMALFNGGTLYLPDRESALPGVKMAEYLKENEISIMTLTPTALSSLPFSDFPHLETINVAGEPCSVELADQWSDGRNFFNLYGPTESTIWASFLKFDENVEQMSIGKPIGNSEVYILDERMRMVPLGVAGELYLGGVGLARGYWERNSLTAERFVPHPFSAFEGERLYKTGDLARFRADGQLEYLGRVDRQVKIRGYRVELGEIESVLNSIKEIKEAVVNPSTDDKGNIWLTAYYVAVEGVEPDTAKIRETMQEELPNYMIPARFVGLEKIPVLPSGKIDRKSLPQPDEAKYETGTAYTAPTNEAESVIVEIWCEILNLKKVGIEDNFFTLGGHSLLLAQMHAKLVQRFEKDVSLIDLFKYPTIKTLAEFLTNESDTETNSGRGRERAETRLDLRNKQADLRRRAREKRSGN